MDSRADGEEKLRAVVGVGEAAGNLFYALDMTDCATKATGAVRCRDVRFICSIDGAVTIPVVRVWERTHVQVVTRAGAS